MLLGGDTEEIDLAVRKLNHQSVEISIDLLEFPQRNSEKSIRLLGDSSVEAL